MLREVDTRDLSVGMYVSDLDRPWLDTPFPVQGFYLRSAEEIARLAEFCQKVYVDPRRYDPKMARAALERVDLVDVTAPKQRRRPRTEAIPPPQVHYDDVASVEDELPAAREALRSSSQFLETFWSELQARRIVRLADVRTAIDPLVDSILRNRDALVALTRVQRADRHTHQHCLAMAVWSGLIGRQLGLLSVEVKKLALGCSLVDIGKVRLPPELLQSEDSLSKPERLILRSHVEYSLEMLAEMGGGDPVVEGIVRWHHERRDGSGYPDRLQGGAIPMYARVAGIVDSYDAMISPRIAAAARSSFEALTELQEMCPERFQSELVEQFAQAVGLFPSGCLVELSSGEVAVVFSQNTGRRLRPKVMLILDVAKRPRKTCPIIDLKAESEQSLRIARELPHGEYGIDTAEYFL